MSRPLTDDRIPVIVGVGEIVERADDPAGTGQEPLALMQAALLRAEDDAGAGAGLLRRLDSIDVVNQVTWPYAAPAAELCARLNIAPARVAYGPVGGESPVRFLNEAAARIARGQSAFAAVCGAEAQNTLDRARRAGVAPAWTPKPDRYDPPLRGADFVRAAALNLGVFTPVTIYPFYENATLAGWGQTPRQGLRESGELWSRSSQVAEKNPYAWLPRATGPEEITTATAKNRLLAWPYTKLMVANPAVNQGAAVLMTSLAQARAAGIADHRLIYVWGGASAQEPRDYLARDSYAHSPSQDAVLAAASGLAGAAGFDALELYSCFPCVPKMARRALGLGPDVQPTVTGGLTFFGAPLNDYMTHATCAMTRRLRASGGTGLLYGQGEFVTKHHALVLAAQPPARDWLSAGSLVQAEADRRRGDIPVFADEASGAASLETFTVIYDREGAPMHGAVIARLRNGRRSLARVPAGDADAIARLVELDRSPVGADGALAMVDGEPHWHFT